MSTKIILAVVGLGLASAALTIEPSTAEANVMTPSIGDILDDVLVESGLTGGNNGASIQNVIGSGSIVFSSGIGNSKAGLLHSNTPRVEGQISCRRSGYRPSQLGSQKWKAAGLRNATQEATVYSQLALDVNEQKTWWSLHEACAAGKTAVMLPVTLAGNCQNVKAVVGPSNQVVTAKPVLANFKLSCNMYDPATIAKCAGGGCG